MPLIKCEGLDARIRNTRHLLATAAVIMSVFLMATSLSRHCSFRRQLLRKEGRPTAVRWRTWPPVSGDSFGTVYDISTILILAFAELRQWPAF